MGLGFLEPGDVYRCCQCTAVIYEDDFAVDPSWDTFTALDTSGGELIPTADDSFGQEEIIVDTIVRYLCIEADISWGSNTEFATIWVGVATTDTGGGNLAFCLGASGSAAKYVSDTSDGTPAAPLGFGMPSASSSGTARFKILVKIRRPGADCSSVSYGAIADLYIDGDLVATIGLPGLTWANYRVRFGVRSSALVNSTSYYSDCSWDNMVVSYS